jgi:hypothetical protein
MEDLKSILVYNKTDTKLDEYFAKRRVYCKRENNHILLIGKRNKTSFKEELIQKYLNAVIDSKTLKIQVYTGGEFNYQIDKEFVNRNFKEYRLYQILDGTRISLWFNTTNQQWTLSTRKLICANEVVWKRDKTYWDVFMDVIKANNFDMDIFKEGYCYNFVIKHPIHHPFLQTAEKEIKTLHLINIFDQQRHVLCEPNTFAKEHGMQFQSEIPEGTINCLEDLFIANKNSVRYCNSQEPNYGYILRTKNFTRTKEYSNIIIYSTVYTIIKNSFYDRKTLLFYNKFIDDDPTVRIIILAVISERNKIELFTKLFPQYEGLVRIVSGLIDKVTRRIIDYYHAIETPSKKKPKLRAISQMIVDNINSSGYDVTSGDDVIKGLVQGVLKSQPLIAYIIDYIGKAVNEQ